MKGPRCRIAYRVERVWRCRTCAKTARTGGDVTTFACTHCSRDGGAAWMTPDEPRPDPRRRTQPPTPGTQDG